MPAPRVSVAYQREYTVSMFLVIVAFMLGGIGNTVIASEAGSELVFAGLRFVFAALLFARWFPAALKLPRVLLLAAACEVASIVVFYLALGKVSVAVVTTIGASGPLIAAAVNRITGRHRLSGAAVAFILMSVVGTTLLAWEGGWDSSTAKGIILAVASILLSTVGLLLNSWYGKDSSSVVRVAASNLIGILVLGPVLLFYSVSDGVEQTITWSMVAGALFLAVLPAGLAKVWVLRALKTIPAPVVMAVSVVSLVSAAVSAWVFLGQPLGIAGIVGMALSCGAIAGLALRKEA